MKKRTTIKDLEKQIKALDDRIRALAEHVGRLNHDMMPYRPIGPCKPFKPAPDYNQIQLDQKLIDDIIKQAKEQLTPPTQCQDGSSNIL